MNTSSYRHNASLVSLNTLLTTRLGKIMQKESKNDDRIHLYETGEYWVGFDKSAYTLEQFGRGFSQTTVLRVPGFSLPIVMCSIHHNQIDDIQRKHAMAKSTLNYLQFITRPIDTPSYDKWYNNYLLESLALYE